MTKREILYAHYRGLMRRAVTWFGLVSLVLGASSIPTAASAAQITARSTTLTSSAAAASTSYAFTWTGPTATTVKGIKFQVCDSPLQQTTCAAPSSASIATATFQTTAPTSAALSSFAISGTQNATQVIISNATGTAGNATFTAQFNAVTNPNTANLSYYTRITTYSDTGASAELDFGAMAVSTARQISLAANVQESLTFCVGTSGTGCGGGGLTGTTVNLGVGSDNVLSSSTPSGGISLMAVDTNATTGYVITYITTSPGGTGGTACAGSLSSSNDCITDFGGTAGTFVAGTGKFGINLRDNATPNIGADISGSGSGAVSAPYNTIDNFAFQAGATPRTVASSTGPTVPNLYTVAYAAQAGNTTKPGAYSATFTWVATGTF
ncbi:MAG TPA: hypothetical protein VMT30_00180 [Candidatus Saccharimonadia bacterium]|nr:hypothetical protein [Candidatus Saccharimonadia bacterium]